MIVNLQRTPLDGLADLRVFAKCDDFTRLVMDKLSLEIPEFRLKRYKSHSFIAMMCTAAIFILQTIVCEGCYRERSDQSKPSCIVMSKVD